VGGISRPAGIEVLPEGEAASEAGHGDDGWRGIGQRVRRMLVTSSGQPSGTRAVGLWQCEGPRIARAKGPIRDAVLCST
jgi:hypothetical protein